MRQTQNQSKQQIEDLFSALMQKVQKFELEIEKKKKQIDRKKGN
jgi:DNA anti-recombination protein RmuC